MLHFAAKSNTIYNIKPQRMSKYVFQYAGDASNNSASNSTDFFNQYLDSLLEQQQQVADTSNTDDTDDFVDDYIKSVSPQEEDSSHVTWDNLKEKLDEYFASKFNQNEKEIDYSAFASSMLDNFDPLTSVANSSGLPGSFKLYPEAADEAVSSTNTKMSVTDKEKRAFNFFLNKGYSKTAAAAIVSNLKHESGFNPTIKGDNGKARGYAQWHPPRYNKLATKFDLTTDEGNLNAVDYELRNDFPSVFESLSNAKTAAEAAEIFDKKYEKSAGLTTRQRMNYANNLLNHYNTTTADTSNINSKGNN